MCVKIANKFEKSGRATMILPVQTTQIIRACTKVAEEKTRCVQNFAKGQGYRDCKATCDSDNCNNNDLIDKMGSEELSQREEPLECKVCGSSEVECGTGEGAETKTCPVWANAGCFSSEKIILANRRYSGTYNRGCSAIPTERSCQTVTVDKAGSIEVDRVSDKIQILYSLF